MNEEILKAQSYLRIPETGVLDEFTEAAIRNFQIKNNFNITGNLLSPDIRQKMGMVTANFTTDLSERMSHELEPVFINHFMPSDQYITSVTNKEYIFLHHTAGWNNPYAVADDWAKDQRGRIATEFIIGGTNIKTNDTSYDGICLCTFKTNGWASHLGPLPIDQHMHSHSIGIELCNFGWLTRNASTGRYFNYIGKEVNPKYVIDLKESFRGFKYYHAYTENQISKLREMLIYLANIHNIDITIGLKKMITRVGAFKAFEFWEDIQDGKVKGLLSHTNVRRDKFDISPQPMMIEMIESL